MIGGRRQMLLVLTLIAGVLCMHALVLLGDAPGPGNAHRQSMSMAADPAAGHADATDGSRHAAAAMMDAVPVAGAEIGALGHDRGHDPGLHQSLHLCVAILAALLVMGMLAQALWRTLRPDRRDPGIGAMVRRAPRRRPPPTSVRLAQLCVLRN